jgi:hypothetical protein
VLHWGAGTAVLFSESVYGEHLNGAEKLNHRTGSSATSAPWAAHGVSMGEWFTPERTQGSPRLTWGSPTGVSVAALRSPARTGRAISGRRGSSSIPHGPSRSTALHRADPAVFGPSYALSGLSVIIEAAEEPSPQDPPVSPAPRRNPQRWRSKSPPLPPTRPRSPSLPEQRSRWRLGEARRP